MSNKHTPGPWSYTTEPQPNGCPIVGNRGLMVAMLAHSINHTDQRQEALANARLITAAPDLLDACEEALGCLNGAEIALPGYVVTALERAITKATGSAA